MEFFAQLLHVKHQSVQEIADRVQVFIGSASQYARLAGCTAWPRSTEADLLIPLRVESHLGRECEVRVRSTDGDIVLALASRFPTARLLFVTSMRKARSIDDQHDVFTGTGLTTCYTVDNVPSECLLHLRVGDGERCCGLHLQLGQDSFGVLTTIVACQVCNSSSFDCQEQEEQEEDDEEITG